MSADLLDRLNSYRAVLDAAIADDLEHGTTSPAGGPRRRSRVLAAAAATVLIVGTVGALLVVGRPSTSSPADQIVGESIPPAVTEPTITNPSLVDEPLQSTTPESSQVQQAELAEPIAMGDSVLWGARSELSARGFTVYASESTTFGDIVETTRMLNEGGRVGKVAVIAAGTSGLPTERQLAEIVENLAAFDEIYFVTMTGDLPWAEQTNATLRMLPDQFDNVEIIEWATESALCDESCFFADAIHLRPTGRTALAEFIERETSR